MSEGGLQLNIFTIYCSNLAGFYKVQDHATTVETLDNCHEALEIQLLSSGQ